MPIAQDTPLAGGKGAWPDTGASMAAFRKVSLFWILASSHLHELTSAAQANMRLPHVAQFDSFNTSFTTLSPPLIPTLDTERLTSRLT
jgi:hypothetical protein